MTDGLVNVCKKENLKELWTNKILYSANGYQIKQDMFLYCTEEDHKERKVFGQRQAIRYEEKVER